MSQPEQRDGSAEVPRTGVLMLKPGGVARRLNRGLRSPGDLCAKRTLRHVRIGAGRGTIRIPPVLAEFLVATEVEPILAERGRRSAARFNQPHRPATSQQQPGPPPAGGPDQPAQRGCNDHRPPLIDLLPSMALTCAAGMPLRGVFVAQVCRNT